MSELDAFCIGTHSGSARGRSAELAARPDGRVARAASHRIELAHWRPGLVDVPLLWDGSQREMLELKCGEGRDALGPCAWDAAKCASALRDDAVDAAYLLASAPTASWDKPIRGAEFLTTAGWSQADLREPWRDWWRHWEKCGDPMPSRLPESFRSTALASVPFDVGGTAWQLRLSRIETVGNGKIEWLSFCAPARRSRQRSPTSGEEGFSVPPDTEGSAPGDADETIGGVSGPAPQPSARGARSRSEITRYSVAISRSFVRPAASFIAIR